MLFYTAAWCSVPSEHPARRRRPRHPPQAGQAQIQYTKTITYQVDVRRPAPWTPGARTAPQYASLLGRMQPDRRRTRWDANIRSLAYLTPSSIQHLARSFVMLSMKPAKPAPDVVSVLKCGGSRPQSFLISSSVCSGTSTSRGDTAPPATLCCASSTFATISLGNTPSAVAMRLRSVRSISISWPS